MEFTKKQYIKGVSLTVFNFKRDDGKKEGGGVFEDVFNAGVFNTQIQLMSYYIPRYLGQIKT